MIEAIANLLGSEAYAIALVAVIDISVVAYVIYRVLNLIRGTRAIQMLVGVMLIIVAYSLSSEEYLDLATLNWVLDKFISYFIVIVVVIFQDDIRRGLAQVGRARVFAGLSYVEETQFFDELTKACTALAHRNVGAIIAIQRLADLTDYTEKGTPLDAKVSRELLTSLFLPSHQNPLHDGAVIIQGGRVTAAGCFLPLSNNPRLDKALGTRHRAAVGLTEQADAVVLVVSEERGSISICLDGRITRDLDPATLRKLLQSVFRPQGASGGPGGGRWSWLFGPQSRPGEVK